jgi:hypothetical protein
MELSITKQRDCKLEGISINFPASTRGWEITFTDCNYRNREQAWLEKEKAATITEKSLSELITEARLGILLVCKKRNEVLRTPRYFSLSTVMRVIRLEAVNASLTIRNEAFNEAIQFSS